GCCFTIPPAPQTRPPVLTHSSTIPRATATRLTVLMHSRITIPAVTTPPKASKPSRAILPGTTTRLRAIIRSIATALGATTSRWEFASHSQRLPACLDESLGYHHPCEGHASLYPDLLAMTKL